MYIFHLCYLFSDSPLSVKNLCEACREVTDWHGLGIQLDLEVHQLDGIKADHHNDGLSRMKTEMFKVWLKNNPDASWTDLITALREMGENKAACDIEAAIRSGNERV